MSRKKKPSRYSALTTSALTRLLRSAGSSSAGAKNIKADIRAGILKPDKDGKHNIINVAIGLIRALNG